jgi:hypothetical protein
MAGHRLFAFEASRHIRITESSVPSRISALSRKGIGAGCSAIFSRAVLFLFLGFLFSSIFCPSSFAQESPYIVTYDHYLEEPGSLEVEYFSTFGAQRNANDFHAYWVEFEYGVTAWYTAEIYLDAQSTFGDSTLFTGFRVENRFRLLRDEHFINPVLYLEYENKNGADKILKEVEGLDVESDYADANSKLRKDHAQEVEIKLLLSKSYKGWNFAINPLAGKNLSNNPWEFGYAIGASRPLALKASPNRCAFCPENIVAGIEMYGGLGDRYHLGLHDTSQYIAPVAAWNLPSGWTLRLSPGFGLNDNSHRFLLRWGVSREFSGFSEMLGQFFGGRR